MREDQENLIRFIFGQIRKVRMELDDLYDKKKRLELMADQFYVSHLDSLWIKTHTQLTEVYNAILDRYNVLSNLEARLLQSAIEESTINIIKPLDPTE